MIIKALKIAVVAVIVVASVAYTWTTLLPPIGGPIMAAFAAGTLTGFFVAVFARGIIAWLAFGLAVYLTWVVVL